MQRLNIGSGMLYKATMYQTTRGVRVTGTDAWSCDAPFNYTAEKVKEPGDTSLIWEGHKAGRDIGCCHLEKLRNLEVLPPFGFTVSCFPHAARTRKLCAGTCIVSGTVSNASYREVGSSCISERRAVEMIDTGLPSTPFIVFGDHIGMEARTLDDKSLFRPMSQMANVE